MDFSPIDPKVILFFSVDCVGSTQLKQASRLQAKSSIENWAPNIIYFYQNFRDRLLQNGISFWKYNGDEILFYVPLKDWNDAANFVRCFQNQIQEQNSSGKGICVKGTMWIAGFPVDNVILQTKGSDSIDFIGPDIDLGFRIASLAKKDRIAMSPDLAVEVIPLLELDQWFYYGRKSLKGIPELDGVPVAFISGGKDCLLDEEDALLGNRVDKDRLESFLGNYLEKSKACVRKKIYADIDAAKADELYWMRYKKITAQLSNLYPECIDYLNEKCSAEMATEARSVMDGIERVPNYSK